jgi:hypothetical protein
MKMVVIMACTGELGIGKTLSLTYIAYKNFLRRKKIYANYKLLFPHEVITGMDDFDKAHGGEKGGFMAMDEFWNYVDSRMSISKRNKFISDILLKLRKRNLDLGYTAQHFGMVDKRLRNITNFMAVPEMIRNDRVCVINVYDPFSKQLVRQYRFNTHPIFKLYDTKQEIERLDDTMEG